MSLRSIVVLLLALAAGCGEPDVAAQRDVGPSPLSSADDERLYILFRAGGYGPGQCRPYYVGDSLDDKERAAYREVCERWSAKWATFFQLNGFPTVEPEHIGPAYFGVMKRVGDRISTCASQHTLGSSPDWLEKQNACDPYDREVSNKGLKPSDIGIVVP